MRRFQTRILALLAPACLAAAGAATVQPAWGAAITNDHRLLQRFIEDGAVVENFWLEGQVRFQSFGDSDVASIAPLLAATFAEDFEVGARIPAKIVDPEDGRRERGFGDMDVWGKIRLTTKPTQFSAGLLLSIPTGSEDRSLRLGTGELDLEFFGGLRHDFEAVSLVANALFRVNQDPDVDPDNEDVREAIGLSKNDDVEGKPSYGLGGALLYSMTSKLSGTVEASWETERIDHLGSDLRLTLGVDYRYQPGFGYRLGGSGGLGDGAPDYELIGSAYFLF